MLLEAKELCGFYASVQGAAVRWAIGHRLETLWPRTRGLRFLGVGYPQPYLAPFLIDAERVLVFMPSFLGVVAWPPTRPLSVSGEETALPFGDAFFDRILVVHCLEGTENVRLLLRQLWRVLVPEGRIVVVVPNRVSLWSLSQASPFAGTRSFRRNELDALLRETLFEPLCWERALCLPPAKGGRSQRLSHRWETIGRGLWPGLAGVHIVEAKKTLYGITPFCKAEKNEVVFVRA